MCNQVLEFSVRHDTDYYKLYIFPVKIIYKIYFFAFIPFQLSLLGRQVLSCTPLQVLALKTQQNQNTFEISFVKYKKNLKPFLYFKPFLSELSKFMNHSIQILKISK